MSETILNGTLSADEQKAVRLMRTFHLTFDEVKVLLHEGSAPALEAMKKYQDPPWSKENVPEFDAFYEVAQSKYQALREYLESPLQ